MQKPWRDDTHTGANWALEVTFASEMLPYRMRFLGLAELPRGPGVGNFKRGEVREMALNLTGCTPLPSGFFSPPFSTESSEFYIIFTIIYAAYRSDQLEIN